MRSSTVPAVTGWPSVTASSATRPVAGALTVAVARAATEPGASTTSATVARVTVAVRTVDGSCWEHAASPTASASAASSAALLPQIRRAGKRVPITDTS